MPVYFLCKCLIPKEIGKTITQSNIKKTILNTFWLLHSEDEQGMLAIACIHKFLLRFSLIVIHKIRLLQKIILEYPSN